MMIRNMKQRIDNTTCQLGKLAEEVRQCRACAKFLPHGVRPVIQVSANAQVLIAGQAPGRKVHASGMPFDDASGDRLRDWMGIDRQQFYNPDQVAILPMGFCFPGSGERGDLPPRPECAPLWRSKLLALMPNTKLTLVIGTHATKYYFPSHKASLTALVRQVGSHPAGQMVLPHPSPRNNIWLKKNPWFQAKVLPELKRRVKAALQA